MYDYYKNILDEHKNDYLFLTRLAIADNLNADCFSKEQLDNLVVTISQYWLDGSSFDDNDLYSIISWVNYHAEEFADCEDYYKKLDEFTESDRY